MAGYVDIDDGDVASGIRTKMNNIGGDDTISIRMISAIAQAAAELGYFDTDTIVYAIAENAFYKYNGSIWVEYTSLPTSADLEDYVEIAGDDMTGELGVPSIQLDISYAGGFGKGQLGWDESNKTFSIGMNANVVQQTGLEAYVYVINKSGDEIVNGSAVSLIGVSSDLVAITLTDATSNVSSRAYIGVTTEDIADDGEGYVTIQGAIRDINTNAFDAGDVIYVDPVTPGTFTDTQPNAPDNSIVVGIVEIKGISTGRIMLAIKPSGRLVDLSDVNGTPLTTDGQFLVWDQSNQYFDNNYNIVDYRRKDEVAFGEISIAGNAVAQSITAGATYIVSNAFDTNGLSSNCTPDATNNKITITSTGKYRVNGNFSFYGINNVIYFGAIFSDGVEQDQIHFSRKISTSGDVGSSSLDGFIDVTSVPIDVDFRIRQDQGTAKNITVSYANLNVHRIGE